jgi:hypothetical protein
LGGDAVKLGRPPMKPLTGPNDVQDAGPEEEALAEGDPRDLNEGTKATPDEGRTDEIGLIVRSQGCACAAAEKERRDDETADHGEGMLQSEDQSEDDR